jgi:hypothetical protein
MIYYLVTERFSSTVRHLLARCRGSLNDSLAWLTYEELFFERAGPLAHYIFADLDRLSRYQLECAAAFALALRRASASVRLLNHPLHALDRLPLLAELHRLGFNDFCAQRLDAGARPSRYPVFIRAEDGHRGAETGLLHDSHQFEAALAELQARGLPLRGRIAVGYAAQPGRDGRFRRYSAVNVGGEIIPDELFVSDHWVVKDAGARWGPAEIAEEFDFVQTNPHRAALARAFAAGRIDYGRADYGIVDGRVQVYEINTNPAFSDFDSPDLRLPRRRLVGSRLAAALRTLDGPIGDTGRVRYGDIRPRLHTLHWPRRRLAHSLARRLWDRLSGDR